MDAFPPTFVPDNTHSFKAVLRDEVSRQMRLEIYQTVLSNDYNNFYDISSFKYNSYNHIHEVVRTIRDELHSLGWKTALSYGDTALFVFTGDKPTACW